MLDKILVDDIEFVTLKNSYKAGQQYGGFTPEQASQTG